MSYSYCDYNPKKPAQRTIFLECGHNPQDAIFEIDDGTVKRDQCFILDRLTIDTSRLYRPQVKIDFSSLIVFAGEDEGTYEPEVEVDLLFQLERVCNGAKEAWITGDIDNAAFMIGQSVGLIHDVPTCQELLERMVGEAREILRSRSALFN
jgi:hypothetical protein